KYPGDTSLPGSRDLALAYQDAGKFDLAVELLEQIVERQKYRGEGDPTKVEMMNHLGVAYLATGQVVKAQLILEQALQDATKLQKVPSLAAHYTRPVETMRLATLHNLVVAYRKQKKLDHAEPLLRELVAARMRINGPGHQRTATAQADLALT